MKLNRNPPASASSPSAPAPASAPASASASASSASSRPSFSRRRPSKRDMEALVTLFKRESSASSSSSGKDDPLEDDVSMSVAGQKVIPATFKVVPIDTRPAQSDVQTSTSAFDQAGGHNNSFKQEGAILVKKVTEREANFYEIAQAGQWPASLLPKYYGRAEGNAIKIENLTHGITRPCVLDLKMGVQTVEDDEQNFLKRLKMKSLDLVTRTNRVGCRLEGLSMYRTLENQRIKGSKVQSHSISANLRVSLQDVLMFFLTDESGVRTDVALRFQTAVEAILRQFEQNDKFRFIGSSILFIYDNDNRAPHMHWARALRRLHQINPNIRLREDQISGLTRQTKCDVRMIDFAHTGPMPEGMKRDEGYITGLNSILKALSAIRMYRKEPIFTLSNAVIDVMEEHHAKAKSARAKNGEQDTEVTFGNLLRALTPLTEGTEDGEEIPEAVPPLAEGAGDKGDGASS